MLNPQHDRARDIVIAGCGTRHLTTIGAIWSLPDTLLGLGFALLSMALPRLRNGLLVAESGRGLAALFLTRRGFGAITFGRVVISATALTPRLLEHESHHVRQYEVLGPFFVPVYLWLHVRHGYWANPLERQAEACASATESPASVGAD
ncbi:MAG TPA: hypothetical protein VF937_02750 [Chloroflexota bacterium]